MGWEGRARAAHRVYSFFPLSSVYSRIQNRVLVRMNLQDSFDREQEFRKWQWAACEMCVGESPHPPLHPAVQRTACGLLIHADMALRDFALPSRADSESLPRSQQREALESTGPRATGPLRQIQIASQYFPG